MALRVFPVRLEVFHPPELLSARFALLDLSPALLDRPPAHYAHRDSFRLTQVRLDVFLVNLEKSLQALEELNALHVYLNPTQIHLECLFACRATLDTFLCFPVPLRAKHVQPALLELDLEVTVVKSVP